MIINPKKMEAILTLAGPERYSHFIKVAADQRKVWGLFKDGWVLMGTDDGKQAFPLWPADVYAGRCANGEWENCVPTEIDLDDLFEALLPKLQESGGLVAIFPTPSNKGVIPEFAQLEDDLRNELSRIE